MQNGNCLAQVLFYGSTGNVCVRIFYPFILLRRDYFTFVAGAGKSIFWYINLSEFLS